MHLPLLKLIGLHTVAHFLKDGSSQDPTNHYLFLACIELFKLHFLVFTKGARGTLRFKQHDIPGLLKQATLTL